MAENEQPVVNNFNIDAQSLIEWVAQNERRSVIQTLLGNGVLHTEDGVVFEALVYENWADRAEEDHKPSITSINVTYGNTEVDPESEALAEDNK